MAIIKVNDKIKSIMDMVSVASEFRNLVNKLPMQAQNASNYMVGGV